MVDITRCDKCKKKFSKLYESDYQKLMLISDGWDGEKICHYCFPKAVDEHLEQDYRKWDESLPTTDRI